MTVNDFFFCFEKIAYLKRAFLITFYRKTNLSLLGFLIRLFIDKCTAECDIKNYIHFNAVLFCTIHINLLCIYIYLIIVNNINIFDKYLTNFHFSLQTDVKNYISFLSDIFLLYLLFSNVYIVTFFFR